MEYMPHPKVRHPRDLLKEKQQRRKQHHMVMFYNDRLLEWITNNILASVILFDLALIVPLLVIPAPEALKLTLGVISSSWIQLWALPALQRSQNVTQRQNEAKADADHETLTYLVTTQEAQSAELKNITQVLSGLKKK